LSLPSHSAANVKPTFSIESPGDQRRTPGDVGHIAALESHNRPESLDQ
jgi:hypothetical protein